MTAGAVAPVRIGTAGWTIPGAHRAQFPDQGSHLARYARRFPAVEINSTFYRSHRAGTLQRWSDAVPDAFRFAVKVPRAITHERRLVGTEDMLDRFLAEIAPLGPKLGPLLVQLPPSFAYDAATVESFFTALRERFAGDVVCEPRHASWFSEAAEAALARWAVARVAADPPPVPRAALPDGARHLAYYRFHGAPKIYFSAYEAAARDRIAAQLADLVRRGVPAWCIFDNTAHGFATIDALATQERLQALLEA